jgi:Flp pilus assembly protein TadD
MKHVARRVALPWAVAAGLAWSAGAWAALPPGAAAEILNLQGSGEARAGNALEWLPARVSQNLGAGDYVRTRDSSRMALLFADQTQVRLHQNTVLQVKAVATADRPLTSLLLEVGRAWAQTRRPAASRLTLQTPVATLGIRGTDWDVEVDADGKTLLTVLSGEVSFSNAHGEVLVSRNEAAMAEPGKAPVKIQLSQPGDRVQWVNALVADPLRHLPAAQLPAVLVPARTALAARNLRALDAALADAQGRASAAWIGVFASARDMLAGQSTAAERRLGALVPGADVPVAAWSMLADLQLANGDTNAAIATLRSGLARWPGTPELRAQLAHTQLLAGRLEESATTLGQPDTADPAPLWLARGALARRRGESGATLDAYSRAIGLAPEDDRGWFGLGSAHTEREDSVPARASLLQALALNPEGPGYRGELGTLETYRNDLAQASVAFAAALADNPSDYVALTGRGLLHLKQGDPAAALEEFLRAGVMEPRYARAKTYTAVAYYQLERREDAIATLQQAIALDDKDPVPWLFLAQIYTDLFRAGDAVQAARAAVQRMPYLKSLNQLANDQQGRANFGAALAFFGMEDWALELAQQGYHPYWGGSHLFLADRFPGEFNKNSELFQGFLSDPLAFGGSPRFSTLLQKPGTYGIAGLTFDHDFYRLWGPSLSVNGLYQGDYPIAYFAKAQRARAKDLPIDVGVSNAPAFFDPTGRADARASVGTLAVGARPTERLGALLYFSQSDIGLRGHNQLDLFGDGFVSSNIDNATRQAVLGFSYRWSPVSQTWLKLGHSTDKTVLDGMPAVFVEGPTQGVLGLFGTLVKRYSDIQARHTVDLDSATRVVLGVEHVKERQFNEVAGVGPVQGNVLGQAFSDTLVFNGFNDIDRRFSALTLAGERRLSPATRVDGTLVANWLRHDVHGETGMAFLALQAGNRNAAGRQETEHVTTPRLGVVFQPRADLTVRAAYQDWLRPLSVSTLNPVETAGIPVEDRLVEAGGRHRRSVAQVGLTVGENTFLSARAEHLRVANPNSSGVDLRTPSLPFLEDLRNAQTVNLSATDVLEEIPSFERGTLRAAALGVNHMFSRQFSGYAKYLHQQSSSSYDAGVGPALEVTGKAIPFLPRSTFIVGATWAGVQRLYLSSRIVYRSIRFEDKENLTARPAGANLDLMGFWETPDKHLVVGAAALNLLGRKSERQIRRLVIDLRYRF